MEKEIEVQHGDAAPSTSSSQAAAVQGIPDEASSIPMPPGEPSVDVGLVGEEDAGTVYQKQVDAVSFFLLTKYVFKGDDEDESSDGGEGGPPPPKAFKPNPTPLPQALQDDLGVQALPEHLSLDEVEAVKKRLKFGSAADRAFVAPIANPSGRVDLTYII